MVQLSLKKGDYAVQAVDILDTLAGGSSGGDIKWKSGTSFFGILHHNNTANQTYTFPNASGTVPLLSVAQSWSGLNTYAAGTFKATNILFVTTGPQIIGGTTLQFFNSTANFIKSTIGNLDMITLGGSSTQRNINFNIDAANDINPIISFQSQAVNWITFDPTNNQFIPLNNVLHLGNTGHKWIDVWATNGTIQTSFSQYKKEIVPMESTRCLQIIKRIDTAFFKWKDDDSKNNFGIIADSLIEDLPEAIADEKGVYDRSLIALTIGALKDIDSRLTKIENNS